MEINPSPPLKKTFRDHKQNEESNPSNETNHAPKMSLLGENQSIAMLSMLIPPKHNIGNIISWKGTKENQNEHFSKCISIGSDKDFFQK